MSPWLRMSVYLRFISSLRDYFAIYSLKGTAIHNSVGLPIDSKGEQTANRDTTWQILTTSSTQTPPLSSTAKFQPNGHRLAVGQWCPDDQSG